MARNEGLLCLICMLTPCGCNKPQGVTPRKAGPRKPVPANPEEPAATTPAVPVKPSFMDKIRQQAAREESTKKAEALKARLTRGPEQSPSRFSEKMTDEEAALLSAVRLLSDAFEIHPDDLEPFKDRLSREPSVEERAGAWRYRRNVEGSGEQ